jgi:hypothetical protein
LNCKKALVKLTKLSRPMIYIYQTAPKDKNSLRIEPKEIFMKGKQNMDYNGDQTLDQYCPTDITDTLMLSGRNLKTITLSTICVVGLTKTTIYF